MNKYDWNKEDIESVVKECDSLTDVLKALGVPRRGNNSITLRKKIEEYGIDISHFTYGNKKKRNVAKYIPASEYLNTHKPIQSSLLKYKLIFEGYKENKCECCGITEWNGKPLVFQIHHKDGNCNNNNLDNIAILCPNCHSQTSNYRGLANQKERYYCIDCGCEIRKGSKRCPSCNHKLHRKICDRPTKEQLVESFKELRSYVKVAERYNVSDNGLRKWVKSYGLPISAREIHDYIENSK